MEKYIGKSVYKGIAIGPVHVLKKKDHLVKRIHVDHVEKELERLEKAKEQALSQLGELYEKAMREVGEVNAALLTLVPLGRRLEISIPQPPPYEYVRANLAPVSKIDSRLSLGLLIT